MLKYKNGKPKNYKNENIERKFFKNLWKNQVLNAKNSILELEKDFTELKDRELKDREVNWKHLESLVN